VATEGAAADFLCCVHNTAANQGALLSAGRKKTLV
jgi:hypothetical protein